MSIDTLSGGTVDVNRLSKAVVWTPNPDGDLCKRRSNVTDTEKKERWIITEKKMETVGGRCWSSKK